MIPKVIYKDVKPNPNTEIHEKTELLAETKLAHARIKPVALSVAGAEPITAASPPKIIIGNIEINVFRMAFK